MRRSPDTRPHGPARAPQGKADSGVVLIQPLLTMTTSQQAAKKIAFPPRNLNHTDLERVLQLASRLMDRDTRVPDGKGGYLPSNVIAFPGSR